MKSLPPHPSNVPGDYYVQSECCTMCNVPQMLAPDLFGEVNDTDGYLHCFVKRQPTTPEEHSRMLEVMASAELACIRYAGRDYDIQKQLVQVVPSEMDHIHPLLFYRFLIGRIKARWAIFKWRSKNKAALKKQR